jgi:hypothetical protein
MAFFDELPGLGNKVSFASHANVVDRLFCLAKGASHIENVIVAEFVDQVKLFSGVDPFRWRHFLENCHGASVVAETPKPKGLTLIASNATIVPYEHELVACSTLRAIQSTFSGHLSLFVHVWVEVTQKSDIIFDPLFKLPHDWTRANFCRNHKQFCGDS